MGACYSTSTCAGSPTQTLNTGNNLNQCDSWVYDNYLQFGPYAFSNQISGNDCLYFGPACTPVYDPTTSFGIYIAKGDPSNEYASFCPDLPFTQCSAAECLNPVNGPTVVANATTLQQCVNFCSIVSLDNRYAFFDTSAPMETACACYENCDTAGVQSVASIQAATVQSAAIQYKFPDCPCPKGAGCAQPVAMTAKRYKGSLKRGQTLRYTLLLTPEDAAKWTNTDLVLTLSPYLSLHKTTASPRIKPYNKPVTTPGAGGATVVTYNDLQRPPAKSRAYSAAAGGSHKNKTAGGGGAAAKGYRPVKVTVVAKLAKNAPQGALPGAIVATLCGGPTASADITVL